MSSTSDENLDAAMIALYQGTRLVQLGFFSETETGGAAQSQNKA